MERNNLLFLIAVVVGLGVVYIAINQAYGTGRAVSSSLKCIDSDNGLDYNSYGCVSYRGTKYCDSCSGNVLVERYCSSNNVAAKRYMCDDGCFDGECGGTGTCDNECKTKGLKECVKLGSQSAYRTCGNYNADQCLEWSSPSYCPAGYACQNGLCTR